MLSIFMPSEPSEPAKSISLPKCLDEIEIARSTGKDVSLRRGGLSGCNLEPSLHACRAQLGSIHQRTDEHQTNGERMSNACCHHRRISTTTRASGSCSNEFRSWCDASLADTGTTENPLRKQACRSQTQRFRLGTSCKAPTGSQSAMGHPRPRDRA